MNEKLVVTAELSKEKAAAVFYLLDEELTPERWKALSETPVPLDLETLDNETRKLVELALVSLAISARKLK